MSCTSRRIELVSRRQENDILHYRQVDRAPCSVNEVRAPMSQAITATPACVLRSLRRRCLVESSPWREFHCRQNLTRASSIAPKKDTSIAVCYQRPLCCGQQTCWNAAPTSVYKKTKLVLNFNNAPIIMCRCETFRTCHVAPNPLRATTLLPTALTLAYEQFLGGQNKTRQFWIEHPAIAYFTRERVLIAMNTRRKNSECVRVSVRSYEQADEVSRMELY